MRLRKQKALLKDQRRNILHYGLRYLDELDTTKKKERLEQKEAEHKELYAINLTSSSKKPGHDKSSSNLPPLS